MMAFLFMANFLDSPLRRCSLVLLGSKEECSSCLQDSVSFESLQRPWMGRKSLHHRWYGLWVSQLRDVSFTRSLVGVFLFANCVNSFLTNVGKVSVGRLRPHFIPSCFQKYSYRDFCTDPNQWIVNYTCLGDSSSVVKEKDGSFDIR